MRVDNRRGNVAPVGLAHEQRGPRARRPPDNNDRRRASFHRSGGTRRRAQAALRLPQSIGHRQAPCLGSKLYIATRISAMRAAASFDHRSPFSAVAARGIAQHAAGRDVAREPRKVCRGAFGLEQLRLRRRAQCSSPCTRRDAPAQALRAADRRSRFRRHGSRRCAPARLRPRTAAPGEPKSEKVRRPNSARRSRASTSTSEVLPPCVL